MRGKNVRLGSISLLFTVAMLCIMMLSVLSLSTARADIAAAKNYGNHVTAWYQCENAAQTWLSETDAALKQRGRTVKEAELTDGAQIKNGVISVVLEEKGVEKDVQLRISAQKNHRYQILAWRTTTQWKADRSLTLWQG